MIVIDKLVGYLICKNIISYDSKKIYAYGLFVFLYNLFLVLNIIINGIILKEFYFTIMFLVFWIPYRIFIGGVHCSTPIRCCFFFNLCYIFALIIYKFIKIDVLVILNIISFTIQLYKVDKKLVFVLFWLVYGCLIIILNSQLSAILSISYLCNSILKLYELYSNRKYLV